MSFSLFLIAFLSSLGTKMKRRKQEQDMSRKFIRSLSQENDPLDAKTRTSKNLLLHVSKKKDLVLNSSLFQAELMDSK